MGFIRKWFSECISNLATDVISDAKVKESFASQVLTDEKIQKGGTAFVTSVLADEGCNKKIVSIGAEISSASEPLNRINDHFETMEVIGVGIFLVVTVGMVLICSYLGKNNNSKPPTAKEKEEQGGRFATRTGERDGVKFVEKYHETFEEGSRVSVVHVPVPPPPQQ